MNKVFNINLGGYPFTIDEDAYEHLSSYLKTIHRHFRSSEGYEEITSDIEARLAELFQEQTGNRPIVTISMVEEAISTMGTPEDFGAEPLDEEPEPRTYTKTKVFGKGIKTGKRLFRNPDDEVIGGVCSGIAAYFGIQDPLWIRIAFILVVFGMGFGIPVYLILWAILPKAETASDRLAMRGETINASNIGKIIEEEIEHLADKMQDLGEELKDEFDSKKKNFAASGGFADVHEGIGGLKSSLTKGISLLGRIIKKVFRTLFQVWKPIVFLVGMALIIAFAVSWIASIIGLFMGFSFLEFLLPGNTFFTPTVVSINLLFVIGIPLVGLILAVMRIFMGSHIKPVWKTGLWVFWAVNFVSLAMNVASTVKDFQQGNEITRNEQAGFTNADTLSVEFSANPYEDTWIRMGDDVWVNGDMLITEDIFLYVEKSESNQFEIEQHHYSRGKSTQMAHELADKIDYEFDLENNKLILPSYFTVAKGEKWRNQQVKIYIKVPENKYIHFANNGGRHHTTIRHMDIDHSHEHPYYGHIWEAQTWQMGSEGLFNPDYIKSNESQIDFHYENFTNLNIEGPMKVFIEKGDHYEIRMEGKSKYRKKIEMVEFGDNLDISYNSKHRSDSPLKLYITMPELNKLSVENNDDVRITGFEQEAMTLNSTTNHGDIKAYIVVDTLKVKQNGRHELDLRGSGKFLSVSMDNEAKLDAEHYTVEEADIKAVNRNRIKLAVTDSIRQDVSPGSRLTVDGNPLVISQ